MKNALPTKRKYDSSRRQLQAEQTRRAIVEAARALIVERGYEGATIEAIAQEAAVSPETIYAIFGSKRKLFMHLVDVSVIGGERPARVMERNDVQAILQNPDPVRQIQLFSADITTILVRVAPVMDALRSAAKTDPEIADLVHRLLKERLKNMTMLMQHVAEHGGLRPGMDVSSAAELTWTMSSPEVFLLLTRERGYSPEQFAAWLEAALLRLLLP